MMALWFCEDCTTAYSVGAPRCPHCKSTNYTEEEPVAKNSVHMGPSNAVTGEGMPEPRGEQTEGVEETVDAGTTSAPEPPDSHAKKAEWVDYAVELGHDRATVESFTRADIVELVGTRATTAHAETATGSGEAGDPS